MAEVKIQVRGNCPAGGDVEQFRNAANFVTATIERVMGRQGDVSTAAFDPLTGEPFHASVTDPHVVQSIGAITVGSPYGALQLLLRRLETEEDIGAIQIELPTVDTSLIED